MVYSVQALLAQGANTEAKNSEVFTTMIYASDTGYLGVMRVRY